MRGVGLPEELHFDSVRHLGGFRNVFDLVNDEQIRLKAERLKAMEEDLKYGKNYATAWRKNKPSVFGEHSTIASGKCRP